MKLRVFLLTAMICTCLLYTSLEEIGQRCQFKYHFFGHYHRNEIVRKKCVLLYEQIIRLK